MKPESWSLYRYELPLIEPLNLPDRTLTTRAGALICFKADDREGWGEAAPLPGFSSETLATVIAEAPAYLDRAWDSPQLPELPSLAFAFYAASVSFAGETASEGMSVPVNALIQPGDELSVIRDLKRALDEGFSTVKLKVGRGDLDEEIRLVQSIRDYAGPGIHVRLDANRAWSLKEARQFCQGVRDCEIEFLEEPLVDPGEWNRLAAETDVPLALDESTRDVASFGKTFKHVAACVAKPTMIGGAFQHRQFAGEAGACAGAMTVFTSSFESGVGINAVAICGAVQERTGGALGLDTIRVFEKDIVQPRIEFDRGFYHVRHLTSKELLLDSPYVEQIADGRY